MQIKIKDFLNSIKRRFERRIQKYMYRNLVFKGGGVRGIAYMGALEVLDKLDVLSNIERVAGTSSGAIAATLVSFRRSAADTIDLFDTLDLQKVPQKAINVNGRNINLLKNNENYTRLFEKYGWYSSEYFHKWLRSLIAGQCRGNPRATFKDFQRMGFRDLHIVASNISRHRAEVFSVDYSPNVSVADAVRMSMSIPLFFEALQFDGKKFGEGDYYVDGGLFNNYPIHIFDQPQYGRSSRVFRSGVNWETLGLFLYPSKLRNEKAVEEPKNLWEFLDLTVRSMYDSHQVSILAENVVDMRRTIEIDDCGVSSTRFDLSPESKEYQQLFKSGRSSAEAFFGI